MMVMTMILMKTIICYTEKKGTTILILVGTVVNMNFSMVAARNREVSFRERFIYRINIR